MCDQDKEAVGNEAWPRHATAALLGSSGVRRPFLEALSRCLGSPDADLVGACLTTAGWLSRSLAAASLDADAADADTSLAAFSALVPRLKQCLAPARPARHRVLAAVSLHNFSKIPGDASRSPPFCHVDRHAISARCHRQPDGNGKSHFIKVATRLLASTD